MSQHAPRGRRSRSVRRSTAGLLALVLATTIVAATPATATTTQTTPEHFTGTVEQFYDVPDPLPLGDPGELIRVQEVSDDSERTTLRIMYHSRDAAERDRAVTGLITFPNRPAPATGWPVVSLAPGTVGLASACALSRHGAPVHSWGLDGVAVMTDYIGTGPVDELQAYLSRPSEAHSVIDAVRAARKLPESGAGSRWVAIGGSQGGHAAIATNELAESYAPELDLLGTVAAAPAGLFDRTYGPLDEIVTRVVGVMGLWGLATDHPEIDVTDYAGPRTLAAAEQHFPDHCMDQIIPAFVSIPGDEFWIQDPAKTEPARSIMLANDIGGVAAESPLMLITGTADSLVVIERARDVYAKLCETGQVTEYIEHEGGTHDDIMGRSAADITDFFHDRFAGEPPTNSCPEQPPASSTTTTSTTATTTPTTVAPLPPGIAPPAQPVRAAPSYVG